jgi:hypothetical protein
MRVRETRITFGVLTALIVLACSKEVRVPTETSLELNSGHCAGCLLNAEEVLFSFVVRTVADYESLTASCFPQRIREEWLPPRPEAKKELVYVSLKGGGCRACLDIVKVHETSRNIIVEVEGGFQGGCDMLIVPGAWALIPGTDKPIIFQFHEVICPDDL